MEGYRRLACEILNRLRKDAKSHTASVKREAREFIVDDGPLFELWCDLARIDRAAFRERIIR